MSQGILLAVYYHSSIHTISFHSSEKGQVALIMAFIVALPSFVQLY